MSRPNTHAAVVAALAERFNIPAEDTNTLSAIAEAILQIPASATGGIDDAPNDGKQYGRQNKAWTEIVGSEPDYITQPSYTDEPMATAFTFGNVAVGGALIFTKDSTMKFADVTKVFEFVDVTGASRYKGDGTKIECSYLGRTTEIITANGTIHPILGYMAFDYSCFGSGDISEITFSQPATQIKVSELMFSLIDDLDSQYTHEVNDIKARQTDLARGVKIGSSDAFIYRPNLETQIVELPAVDANIVRTNPLDLGEFSAITDLPPCPTDTRYFAGVGGDKYSPQYSPTGSAPTVIITRMTDQPINPINVIWELRWAADMPQNTRNLNNELCAIHITPADTYAQTGGFDDLFD